MALILIATPGAADAENSFLTLTRANTLLAEQPQAVPWFETSVSMEQRVAALLTGTRSIETQVRWYGRPTTTTQALSWPQEGQQDHLGRPIPSTVIPVAIQRATALYGLFLLDEMLAETSGAGTSQIKSTRMGDLAIVYQDQAPVVGASLRLPTAIRQILAPYGAVSGGICVPLLRT